MFTKEGCYSFCLSPFSKPSSMASGPSAPGEAALVRKTVPVQVLEDTLTRAVTDDACTVYLFSVSSLVVSGKTPWLWAQHPPSVKMCRPRRARLPTTPVPRPTPTPSPVQPRGTCRRRGRPESRRSTGSGACSQLTVPGKGWTALHVFY